MNAPSTHTLFPGFFTEGLATSDPLIAGSIADELIRQSDEIELIASENIVSRAVLEAQGSVMTNKYAEGYPGKRYYGGCEYVDVAESLAIERAKQLFGAEYANVQPHSGAQANQAVFFALLQPGDAFMGLDLACGGHLTHGSPVNTNHITAVRTAAAVTHWMGGILGFYGGNRPVNQFIVKFIRKTAVGRDLRIWRRGTHFGIIRRIDVCPELGCCIA